MKATKDDRLLTAPGLWPTHADRAMFEINLQSRIRSFVYDTLELHPIEGVDSEEVVEDMAEAASDEIVRIMLDGKRPRE